MKINPSWQFLPVSLFWTLRATRQLMIIVVSIFYYHHPPQQLPSSSFDCVQTFVWLWLFLVGPCHCHGTRLVFLSIFPGFFILCPLQSEIRASTELWVGLVARDGPGLGGGPPESIYNYNSKFICLTKWKSWKETVVPSVSTHTQQGRMDFNSTLERVSQTCYWQTVCYYV